MGYLIAFILGAVVLGALLSQRVRTDSRDPRAIFQRGRKAAVIAVAVLILILFIGQAFIVIQAGTVGVVKRLGAVRSELKPGLHTIVPFIDTVVRYPTVKKTYEAQQVLYDEIAPKFARNGLILDELVLRNITFTPEYAKTLEEKQIAFRSQLTGRAGSC